MTRKGYPTANGLSARHVEQRAFSLCPNRAPRTTPCIGHRRHRACVGAVGERRQEFGELGAAMLLALRVARAAAVEGGRIEAADVSAAVVAAASLALPPKSGDLRATRSDRASSSWPTNSYASSRPCRDGSTILSDVRGPTLAIAYEPCGRPPGHGEEGFPAV